jgi:hypothetical protein
MLISYKNMKNAYRLYRRNTGVFYLENNDSGIQKSLRTKDSCQAEKLLNAANDERQATDLNLSLGKTYLTHADPAALKRVWQMVIDELSSRGKEPTRRRYVREFRSKAYDLIREKPLVQTTSDDLRTVMKRGTKTTNRALRTLHNLALGSGWIHWNIINPRQWPECPETPRRAITQEEHEKIIAADGNDERRYYYQMLWEIGAAQTDCSLLTAEMFNWEKRVLTYQRKKTGEWCHMGFIASKYDEAGTASASKSASKLLPMAVDV